jgi:hypothetical protein
MTALVNTDQLRELAEKVERETPQQCRSIAMPDNARCKLPPHKSGPHRNEPETIIWPYANPNTRTSDEPDPAPLRLARATLKALDELEQLREEVIALRAQTAIADRLVAGVRNWADSEDVGDLAPVYAAATEYRALKAEVEAARG